MHNGLLRCRPVASEYQPHMRSVEKRARQRKNEMQTMKTATAVFFARLSFGFLSAALLAAIWQYEDVSEQWTEHGLLGLLRMWQFLTAYAGLCIQVMVAELAKEFAPAKSAIRSVLRTATITHGLSVLGLCFLMPFGPWANWSFFFTVVCAFVPTFAFLISVLPFYTCMYLMTERIRNTEESGNAKGARNR